MKCFDALEEKVYNLKSSIAEPERGFSYKKVDYFIGFP